MWFTPGKLKRGHCTTRSTVLAAPTDMVKDKSGEEGQTAVGLDPINNCVQPDVPQRGRAVMTYGCVKSFCYLGDTFDGDGGADLAATARIRNGCMKYRELLPFLTFRAPPLEMKGRMYASCVRSSMTYGSETRPLLADVGLKFERAEMQMIRWMCGVSMKDRRTSEKFRNLAGVQPITTVIRSGRLRWYGHVMSKSDKDWVKKCIEL